MGRNQDNVRIVRIFVSSPGDVAEERKALDEVVQRINGTDGEERGIEYRLFKWEKDVVPRIGPPPQKVVDGQTPDCGVYLGIMWGRFGTPTGRHGSGTEKEFEDALKKWAKTGRPWILFYFRQDQPNFGRDPKAAMQYAKVLAFQKKVMKLGIAGSYEKPRGSSESFFEQVELHLRKILRDHLGPLARPKPRPRAKKNAVATKSKPVVPPGYIEWLRESCAEMELLGLQQKSGRAPNLTQVYVPLRTYEHREAVGDVSGSSSGEGQLIVVESELSLLSLLDRESLYVSGPPGSGKSTFCKWVAWLSCVGKLPRAEIPAGAEHTESYPTSFRGRLPVRIPLREIWQHLREDGVEPAIARWVQARIPRVLDAETVLAHLAAGSTLLILDGVDEVPTLDGEGDKTWHPRAFLVSALKTSIPAWTAKGNRILLTSRPYGLTPPEVAALKIPSVEVSPLDEALQELLVRRWFRILCDKPADGEAEAAAMLEHMGSRPDLEPLRTSPMLLGALCILFQEGRRLPQDRAELYARLVDHVLHNRYLDAGIEIPRVRNRLAVVGHGMHTGTGLGQNRRTPQFEVTHDEIERMLGEYKQETLTTEHGYLRALAAREDLLSRSGLLLPKDGDRGSFYHPSFQEFLAALRELGLKRADLLSVFKERADELGWHNTLSFLYGSLLFQDTSPTSATALLSKMIRALTPEGFRLAVLAGSCLRILKGRGWDIESDVIDTLRSYCLAAIEREVPIQDRWHLGRVLGELGDPRVPTDARDPSLYVEVPAGDYPLGDEMKPFRIKKPFRIARFPVTNAQFVPFVEKGYDPGASWWSKAGRKWLKEVGAKEPRSWRRDEFNGPTQPVVAVTFYEAEAFAHWAGGRLPTEEEWEAAARGPKGFEYAWGGAWEDGICNTEEAGLKKTSPVGLFPRSRSKAFGLDDMAGNVWGWCDSVYDGGMRVLRGGSWALVPFQALALIRGWSTLDNRKDYFGFRLVW